MKENKAPAPERLSCNGVEMIREYISKPEAEEDYVYDVYFAEQVGQVIFTVNINKKYTLITNV